ncbi:unnamed protein product, partial [Phaeothamnion confervicola]
PFCASASATAATQADAKITDKIFLEVRIFEPLSEENGYSSANSYRGKIVVGLYGEAAPQSVSNFLEFSEPDYSVDKPSYASGLMTRLEPGVIVEGGRIKGLNTVPIAGSSQLEYRGQILPNPPIIEANALSHDSRGLLTKVKFSPGSEFGITLAPAPELDARRVVFGRVLEGMDVLQALEAVPIYGEGSVQEEGSLADNVFRAQKQAMMAIGKNVLKDGRAVDRTGSFLRRVDISGVGRVR